MKRPGRKPVPEMAKRMSTATGHPAWHGVHRDILRSIRDPTNEMIDAACTPERMMALGLTSVEAREIWQSMIDEALK